MGTVETRHIKNKGELMFFKKLKKTKYARLAVATAMAIGNGRIKKYKEMDLVIKHNMKQLDFLIYKCEMLQYLFDKKINIRQHPERNYAEFNFRHPIFRRIKRKLYQNGVKTITLGILNQLRHPAALALWFMDAGSLSFIRKDGRIQNRVGKLGTHSFTESENILIRDWLQSEFGINARVNHDCGYSYLRFGAMAMNKLIEYIKPFVIPSMQYKIDMRYNKVRDPQQV